MNRITKIILAISISAGLFLPFFANATGPTNATSTAWGTGATISSAYLNAVGSFLEYLSGQLTSIQTGTSTTLAQLSTAATTTGNIFVASSTTGWNTLPVGPNGYCPQASSTASLGIAWAICGGSINGVTSQAYIINASGTGLSIIQNGATTTVTINPAAYLQPSNNLFELTSTSSARTNIGYSGGTNINISGAGAIGITGQVAVANGGTGTSTIPTDHQFLGGNGTTPTWMNLVAGTNVSLATTTTSTIINLTNQSLSTTTLGITVVSTTIAIATTSVNTYYEIEVNTTSTTSTSESQTGVLFTGLNNTTGTQPLGTGYTNVKAYSMGIVGFNADASATLGLFECPSSAYTGCTTVASTTSFDFPSIGGGQTGSTTQAFITPYTMAPSKYYEAAITAGTSVRSQCGNTASATPMSIADASNCSGVGRAWSFWFNTQPAVNITLLISTSTGSGTYLYFKDRNGTVASNTVTLYATSTDLIDSSTQYTFNTPYQALHLVNDATGRWLVTP